MARMGIPMVDKLARSSETSMPLKFLQGYKIGIDAEYFLEQFLLANRETLLAALGGSPLVTGPKIKEHLGNITSAGCELYFIFNGVQYGVQSSPFAASQDAAKKHSRAFNIYEEDKAQEACDLFKSSGAPTAHDLCEYLKVVLHDAGIPFIVAPFSAAAQLVYMEGLEGRFLDGIYASTEALLYGSSKIMTKFVLEYEDYEELEDGFPYKKIRFNLDRSSVSFIEREKIMEQTVGTSENLFQDVLLLSGSNLLEPFPLLSGMSEEPTLRDVTQLLMVPVPRTAIQLCTSLAQHPLMKDADYVNKYKRALASIKHPVVNMKDGEIGPRSKEHAPSDLHDCVGLQLPWELLHYVKYGMVSPRVLSQLTTGLIHVRAPLGGGESERFQEFVRNGLERIRKQSLNILTSSLNRWYARREIREKYFFDQEQQNKFTTHDLPDLPKSLKWQVTPLPPKLSTRSAESSRHPPDLSFLLKSLSDESFAKRTFPSSKSSPLSTPQEITANATYRFLQLRSYIDTSHHLTPSGRILLSALDVCGPKASQQEAVLLAHELLSQNLLTTDPIFPTSSTTGPPSNGSEADRRNATLIARVTSLGSQTHQARGYRGPLSRNLLYYHSFASEVFTSFRDLLEMCLVTMFLDNQVDRSAIAVNKKNNNGDEDEKKKEEEEEEGKENNDDGKALFPLNLALPFKREPSCALGVMMLSYLDEIARVADQGRSIDEALKSEVKGKMKEWIPGADTEESFHDAEKLWDAVFQAVVTGSGNSGGGGSSEGPVFPDVNVDEWKQADEWFATRR